MKIKTDYRVWNFTYRFGLDETPCFLNCQIDKKCNYRVWNFFWFYQQKTKWNSIPDYCVFLLELLIEHSTLLKLLPRAIYPWWAWLAGPMWPWPHEVHWQYYILQHNGVPNRAAALVYASCVYLDNCICYICRDLLHTVYVASIAYNLNYALLYMYRIH